MPLIITSKTVFYKTQGINLMKDMQENCKVPSLTVKMPTPLNDQMQ